MCKRPTYTNRWKLGNRFYSPEDGYEFMYPEAWVGDSVSVFSDAIFLENQQSTLLMNRLL